MKKFVLTNDNYFSSDAQQIYTGSSEIKAFLECEACALAKIKGEWIEETSKNMLVSSYIDAWMSDELEEFKELNPDIFLKSGELKADYKLANNVIEQIKADPMFLKYISGQNQVIMTGEISGVPVKIKIDSFFPDKAIVDLKSMATLDLQWSDKEKKKLNFIDNYRYTLQAALYQEIVRQNTGKQLPFIIAVCTKEKYSRRALLQIPQDIMDSELQFLKEYLPHLQKVKTGEITPTTCNECDYCISRQKVDCIYYYDDFFKKEVKI